MPALPVGRAEERYGEVGSPLLGKTTSEFTLVAGSLGGWTPVGRTKLEEEHLGS